MIKLPCTFKEVKNVNGVFVGYRCCFSVLLTESLDKFIPVEAHLFTSTADALDNALLAKECDISSSLQLIYIVATPTHFPTLFKLIQDYVSETNSNKKC